MTPLAGGRGRNVIDQLGGLDPKGIALDGVAKGFKIGSWLRSKQAHVEPLPRRHTEPKRAVDPKLLAEPGVKQLLASLSTAHFTGVRSNLVPKYRFGSPLGLVAPPSP